MWSPFFTVVVYLLWLRRSRKQTPRPYVPQAAPTPHLSSHQIKWRSQLLGWNPADTVSSSGVSPALCSHLYFNAVSAVVIHSAVFHSRPSLMPPPVTLEPPLRSTLTHILLCLYSGCDRRYQLNKVVTAQLTERRLM